ncbi:hypothetical protein V8E55_002965 [Tylopilus felleus]
MLILSLTTIFLFIAALAGVVAAAPAPFGARRGEMVLPMQLRHGHLRMRKHGTDQLTCKVFAAFVAVIESVHRATRGLLSTTEAIMYQVKRVVIRSNHRKYGQSPRTISIAPERRIKRGSGWTIADRVSESLVHANAIRGRQRSGRTVKL